MNARTLGRRLTLAAAMTLSGFYGAAADAAVVHGASTDAIEHSYGRAGGLTGSDEVSEPKAWEETAPTVTVTYSPDVAQWTNMPRDQAHEGPVTDAWGTASAPQPEVMDHWYGRAGGVTGSDAIGMPNTSAAKLGSGMDSQ
jgi:hypothetical protein